MLLVGSGHGGLEGLGLLPLLCIWLPVSVGSGEIEHSLGYSCHMVHLAVILILFKFSPLAYQVLHKTTSIVRKNSPGGNQ
jgi:hypothetical protein